MDLSILIIEDENFFLKPLSNAFKKEGFKVSEAMNGDAGLKKAKHEKPDLIFLDIIMPGMDGLDVLINMRQNKGSKNTPVVILTSVEHSMRESEIDVDKACIRILKINAEISQLVEFMKLFRDKYSQNQEKNVKKFLEGLKKEVRIK